MNSLACIPFHSFTTPPYGSDSLISSNRGVLQGRKQYVHILTHQLTVRYKIPSTDSVSKFFSWIGSCFGLQPIMTEKVTIITPTHVPSNVPRITQVVIGEISPLAPSVNYDCESAQFTILPPGQVVGIEETELGISLPIRVQTPTYTDSTPLLAAPNLSFRTASISIQETQEIESFYESCLKQPIYASLTDRDKIFLKEFLIPNLITAKYILIKKHQADPSTTWIMRERDGPASLMNFGDLVQKARDSGRLGEDSYFFKLPRVATDSDLTSTLEPPSRTPMSVKIYKDGNIKFVIPHPRSLGNFKKGSHITQSDIKTQNQFEHCFKLSSHKDLRPKIYMETQTELISECMLAQTLGFPFFNRMRRASFDRVQMFCEPKIPLLDLLIHPRVARPAQKLMSIDQVIEKVDQLFEVTLQLLKQLEKIDNKGYVHSDIKPENILVKKRVEPDGSEHLDVVITDFGLTTKKYANSIGGTPDYFLKCIDTNTKERDIYALGKTFDDLLNLLFVERNGRIDIKYVVSSFLTEEQILLNHYISKLYNRFRALNKQMYGTTNNGREYNNNFLYSDIIATFEDVNLQFKNRARSLHQDPKYQVYKKIVDILERGHKMPLISQLIDLKGSEEPFTAKFKKHLEFYTSLDEYFLIRTNTSPAFSKKVIEIKPTIEEAFISELLETQKTATISQLLNLTGQTKTLTDKISKLHEFLNTFAHFLLKAMNKSRAFNDKVLQLKTSVEETFINELLEIQKTTSISELLNLKGPTESLTDKIRKLGEFLLSLNKYSLLSKNQSATFIEKVTELKTAVEETFIREVFEAFQTGVNNCLDSMVFLTPTGAIDEIQKNIGLLESLFEVYPRENSLFNPEFYEIVSKAIARLDSKIAKIIDILQSSYFGKDLDSITRDQPIRAFYCIDINLKILEPLSRSSPRSQGLVTATRAVLVQKQNQIFDAFQASITTQDPSQFLSFINEEESLLLNKLDHFIQIFTRYQKTKLLELSPLEKTTLLANTVAGLQAKLPLINPNKRAALTNWLETYLLPTLNIRIAFAKS